MSLSYTTELHSSWSEGNISGANPPAKFRVVVIIGDTTVTTQFPRLETSYTPTKLAPGKIQSTHVFVLRDLVAGINILFIKAWLRGGISFVVKTLEITPGGFGGGLNCCLIQKMAGFEGLWSVFCQI